MDMYLVVADVTIGLRHVWAVYLPVMTMEQGVSQHISHGQLHQSAMVSHVQ